MRHLDRRSGAAVGAAPQIYLLARRGVEPVFHVERDRATQRIPAKEWDLEAGNHVNVLYGEGWDRVPEDGVAEALVDARAALIDRKAFCRTQHGRRVETAVV